MVGYGGQACVEEEAETQVVLKTRILSYTCDGGSSGQLAFYLKLFSPERGTESEEKHT